MGCGGSTPETTIEPVDPKPADDVDEELPAYMKEIKALKAMLDDGLLTQDEYDVQKKAILEEERAQTTPSVPQEMSQPAPPMMPPMMPRMMLPNEAPKVNATATVPGGQPMIVNIGGQPMSVMVPEGVSPGEMFTFVVPPTMPPMMPPMMAPVAPGNIEIDMPGSPKQAGSGPIKVDTTGDGVKDSVLVDTTGDGMGDTLILAPEEKARRQAALEKALRDAMPGWLGWWTDRDTATLDTAIAQAEAAFPPEGSSLEAALLEAKAVLRGKEEAKAKEAEEEAQRCKLKLFRGIENMESWPEEAKKKLAKRLARHSMSDRTLCQWTVDYHSDHNKPGAQFPGLSQSNQQRLMALLEESNFANAVKVKVDELSLSSAPAPAVWREAEEAEEWKSDPSCLRKFVFTSNGKQYGMTLGELGKSLHDPYRCNRGGVEGEYGRANQLVVCSPENAITLYHSRVHPDHANKLLIRLAHADKLLIDGQCHRCINVNWWKLVAGTGCNVYDAFPAGSATGQRWIINADGSISCFREDKRHLVLGLSDHHTGWDVVKLVHAGAHNAIRLEGGD